MLNTLCSVKSETPKRSFLNCERKVFSQGVGSEDRIPQHRKHNLTEPLSYPKPSVHFFIPLHFWGPIQASGQVAAGTLSVKILLINLVDDVEFDLKSIPQIFFKTLKRTLSPSDLCASRLGGRSQIPFPLRLKHQLWVSLFFVYLSIRFLCSSTSISVSRSPSANFLNFHNENYFISSASFQQSFYLPVFIFITISDLFIQPFCKPLGIVSLSLSLSLYLSICLLISVYFSLRGSPFYLSYILHNGRGRKKKYLTSLFKKFLIHGVQLVTKNLPNRWVILGRTLTIAVRRYSWRSKICYFDNIVH